MGQFYQKILTKTVSPLIHFAGIHHITRPVYSGRGHILMMHRVIPESGRTRVHNHRSLEISPAHLEDIVLYFRKRNYEFISLDRISEWLNDSRKERKRFVTFTFDDGYRDNLEFAWPVLRKYGVPFTIYITNSFPEKKALIWWYILEDLILKVSGINYSFETGRVKRSCSGIHARETVFNTVRNHILRMNQDNLSSELERFFDYYGFDAYSLSNELTLSWDNIAELAADPLVSIGSHTLNHYNLINLPDEIAWSEIAESQRIIESRINKKVLHFCYPLGKYGKRELELVKRSGFMTATTIKTANIFSDHTEHLLSLPRIHVNALTTEKVLDLQLNGFFPAILNRFKPVVS